MTRDQAKQRAQRILEGWWFYRGKDDIPTDDYTELRDMITRVLYAETQECVHCGEDPSSE